MYSHAAASLLYMERHCRLSIVSTKRRTSISCPNAAHAKHHSCVMQLLRLHCVRCTYLLSVHAMTHNQAVGNIFGKMADPAAHEIKHSTVCRNVLAVDLRHLLSKHIINMLYNARLVCTAMSGFRIIGKEFPKCQLLSNPPTGEHHRMISHLLYLASTCVLA